MTDQNEKQPANTAEEPKLDAILIEGSENAIIHDEPLTEETAITVEKLSADEHSEENALLIAEEADGDFDDEDDDFDIEEDDDLYGAAAEEPVEAVKEKKKDKKKDKKKAKKSKKAKKEKKAKKSKKHKDKKKDKTKKKDKKKAKKAKKHK